MTALADMSNRFFDAVRSDDAVTAAAGKPSHGGFGHLAGHRYCLVVTYKRSGDPVPTPVWFGLDDDGHVYFRSYANLAKLQRIRNNPTVRLAPCDRRGKPLGPPAEGVARVLDREDAHAERTIATNYGTFRRVYKRFAGGIERRYVEVTPV